MLNLWTSTMTAALMKLSRCEPPFAAQMRIGITAVNTPNAI
jgi:hypothetical protein